MHFLVGKLANTLIFLSNYGFLENWTIILLFVMFQSSFVNTWWCRPNAMALYLKRERKKKDFWLTDPPEFFGLGGQHTIYCFRPNHYMVKSFLEVIHISDHIVATVSIKDKNVNSSFCANDFSYGGHFEKLAKQKVKWPGLGEIMIWNFKNSHADWVKTLFFKYTISTFQCQENIHLS